MSKNRDKNNTQKDQIEEELTELAEADAQGGGTPVVAVSVAVSLAFCPTGKCTSKC